MRIKNIRGRPFRFVISAASIACLAALASACGGSSSNGGDDDDDGQGDPSDPDNGEVSGDLPDFFESATVSSHGEFQSALDDASEYSPDDEDVEEGAAFLIEMSEDIEDGFDENGALTYDGNVSLYIRGDTTMRTLDAGGHSRILEIDSIPGDDDVRIWISETRFTGGVIDDGSFEYGGAIHSDHHLVVEDSEFANNMAPEASGGAVYCHGDVEIRNTSFSGNSSGERGGAVYMTDGSAEQLIVDSDFSDNEAGHSGGAIYAEEVTVHDSVFTDNEAVSSVRYDRGGGAIHASGGEINGSEFSGNTADLIAGAVLHYYLTSLDIADSEFTENRAGNRGGAIGVFENGSTNVDDSDISVNVENSVFDSNGHPSGGVIDGGAIIVSAGQGAVDIVSADSSFIDNDAPPLVVDTGELVDEGGNTFEPEDDRPDEWN